MTIIKKLLMALGVVCIGLVSVAIFLQTESNDFERQNEQFVSQFMHEFSEDWSMEQVSSKVSYEFVSMSQTDNGKLVLANFKTLGHLKTISNLELVDHIYFFSDRPNVGIYTFDAMFEHGMAEVQLILSDSDVGVKVQLMNMDPRFINNQPSISRSQA